MAIQNLNLADVARTPHVWNEGRIQEVNTVVPREWWGQLRIETEQSAVTRSEFPSRYTPLLKGIGVQSEPSPSPSEKIAEDAIKLFLRAHHLKASQGDIQGYLTDYAERVDYFSDGFVGHQHIAQDQRSYRQKFPKATETIVGDVDLQYPRGRIQAVYKLRSELEDVSGEWRTVLSSVTLHIVVDRGEPKIIKQRSQPTE